MFFRAVLHTLRTLKSPHFIALLIKTALMTLIVFMALMAIVGVALRTFDFFDNAQAELAADIAVTFATSIIGLLLLPTLVPAIAALFQENIANKIEKVDYPDYMPPKGDRKWYLEILEDTKFVILLIILNIFILFFFFIPPIFITAYYGFNAYLIGREFFETAAARHLGRKGARKLRKANRLPAILCGLTIVLLANIPILNLTAPFIGVALMVHLYHLLEKEEPEILNPEPETEAPTDAKNHSADFEPRYPVRNAHVVNKKRK